MSPTMSVPEPAITKALPRAAVITAWQIIHDHLAIAAEGDLYIYHFSNDLLDTLQSKGNTIWSLAWWEDKNALLTAGTDGEIRVWDMNTRSIVRILRGHTATVRCLQIINGATLISGSRDSTIRIWDLTSDSANPTLRLEGHTETVRCVKANGDLIVSGSYDSDARVWDIHKGECLHVLKGHQGPIYNVDLDGNRIVTGGLDTEIRIWDPQSGSCLAVLSGNKGLVSQLDLQENSLFRRTVWEWSRDGLWKAWTIGNLLKRMGIVSHLWPRIRVMFCLGRQMDR